MNYMKFKSLCKYIALSFGLIIVSCIEEQNVQMEEKVSFEVAASFIDVKTTNFGMSTLWSEDDAINVFHSETGTADYINDGMFTVAQPGLPNGVFRGYVDTGSMNPDKLYDWYAIYPYIDGKEYLDSVSEHYVIIGGLEPQKQVGANDMSHLAGSYVPLYGQIKSIPFDGKPSFKMQHMASVVEIAVFNATSEIIDVESVSITSPKNIIGEFIVDVTDAMLSFKDGQQVSRKAILNSSEAEVLPGRKSSFYLVVKPFEMNAGEELIVSVNGLEKKVSISSDVIFSEGTIKTINYTYENIKSSDVEMPIVDWGISKDEVKAFYKDDYKLIFAEDELIYRHKYDDYTVSYSFDDDCLTASSIILKDDDCTNNLVEEWMYKFSNIERNNDYSVYVSSDGRTLSMVCKEKGDCLIAWGAVENRGEHNSHEYVDLGLSVMWATCNVGADSPEEYGGYYAWGEVKEKDVKNYTRAKYEHREEYIYPEGNSILIGKDIGANIGGTKYDVARALWGDSWRMPTRKEMLELIEQCTWTEETLNGIKGMRVSSVNGESIFIPYGGECEEYPPAEEGRLRGQGSRLRLWTDTCVPSHISMDAYCLKNNSIYEWYRWHGMNVRAVVNNL